VIYGEKICQKRMVEKADAAVTSYFLGDTHVSFDIHYTCYYFLAISLSRSADSSRKPGSFVT
jgi:hypothetical protein